MDSAEPGSSMQLPQNEVEPVDEDEDLDYVDDDDEIDDDELCAGIESKGPYASRQSV